MLRDIQVLSDPEAVRKRFRLYGLTEEQVQDMSEEELQKVADQVKENWDQRHLPHKPKQA